MQSKRPNVKKNSNSNVTGVDRISNLSDSILCHILSFLPAKQVVATNILSRRWEFLWSYVETLDFDFDESHPNHGVSGKMQFPQFVHRVLHLHRAPRIKKMHLCCIGSSCDTYDFVTWIKIVILKNVECLHLDFNEGFKLKLPLCFFYCQTLVKLTLFDVDMTEMLIPAAPYFPSLKKLYLNGPKVEINSLKSFISGCSILQYLYLYCGVEVEKTCYIASATLKKIWLDGDIEDDILRKVVLDTPALEMIKVSMHISEFLVESSMPSFIEAQIIPFDVDSCLSSLACLSNVQRLYLEAMDSWPSKLDFHVDFRYLVQLEIKAPHYGFGLLRNFVEKADNLEVIVFIKTERRTVSRAVWEDPKHVPKCLLSSLKLVSITGYENDEQVELMIEYLLGNAEILEEMEIRTLDSVKNDNQIKFHMLQKISKFPRASKFCKISFS